MDGLLFDTETMFFNFMSQACPHEPESTFYALMGCDSALAEKFGPRVNGAMQTFQANRMSIFYEQFPRIGSANKPGLDQLLAFVHEHKLPYCVASSSSRVQIEAMLAHSGLDFKPVAILSSKDGYASKPDPAIFLACQQYLPGRLLICEDSKNGLLAAKAAGIESVWIEDRVAADKELLSALVYEAKDLSGVIDLLSVQ